MNVEDLLVLLDSFPVCFRVDDDNDTGLGR
jgi:hypothetical protein